MAIRTLTVSAREAGQGLIAWLAGKLTRGESDVRRLVRAGKVRVAGQPCRNLGWRVRPGQRVEVEFADRVPSKIKPSPPAVVETPHPATAGIVLRFVDAHLVVVDSNEVFCAHRAPIAFECSNSLSRSDSRSSRSFASWQGGQYSSVLSMGSLHSWHSDIRPPSDVELPARPKLDGKAQTW